MTQSFTPGQNIAMKVPPHEFDQTVAFYRDVLGFEQLSAERGNPSPRFAFGDKVLWIDAVPGCTQAEIWLEVSTPNPAAAAAALAQAGVQRCDAVEPLPPGFNGYWISSPCNIVHLVSGTADAAEST
ncbi:MAG: hypothetical protein ABF271_02010 [Abyssibacter sp.]|uniref:hypothetical protein n=1 Tax=Abyssibacter sp. TaxID=2320200 RepID=UPI003218F62A